jgi:hypothetical protein
MKRYFCFVLVFVFFFSTEIFSEDLRIENIRERSFSISKSIENDEVLYHTMNLTTLVPGIGYQNTNILFYYEFFQEEETIEVYESLAKITIDYNIAASAMFYIEYLFDEKEQLIFHYYRAGGYECGERRHYFDKEKLIKAKSNPLVEDCVDSEFTTEYEYYERMENFTEEDLENGQKIMKKAKEYKKMFEHIVEIEQLDKSF